MFILLTVRLCVFQWWNLGKIHQMEQIRGTVRRNQTNCETVCTILAKWETVLTLHENWLQYLAKIISISNTDRRLTFEKLSPHSPHSHTLHSLSLQSTYLDSVEARLVNSNEQAFSFSLFLLLSKLSVILLRYFSFLLFKLVNLVTI